MTDGRTLKELRLEQSEINSLSAELVKKRNQLCNELEFEDSMFDYAKDFAEADCVVVAAPYWDMSFPAVLKQYIENICVRGITSCYDSNGMPKGLCKAEKLIYVTTSGGPIGPYNYGYDYIKGLCNLYFGIENVEFYSVEGLDLVGNDPQEMMEEAIRRI